MIQYRRLLRYLWPLGGLVLLGSGALSVVGHQQAITVYLRGGQIDFASSEGLRGEFLLGRYLVDGGSIGRPTLDQTLRASGSEQRLLGDLAAVVIGEFERPADGGRAELGGVNEAQNA